MNYRDNVVDTLKGTSDLKDGTYRKYVFTHTHDDSPNYFYVTAPYDKDTMNALVAYIQHVAFGIDDTYGMDQSEAIRVLTELYECEIADETESAFEIDLFLNWEVWASADLITILAFEREGLDQMLRAIIAESVS